MNSEIEAKFLGIDHDEIRKKLNKFEAKLEKPLRNMALGNAEIVLDTWPWLKPYMEIESTDIESVKETAKSLGLKWKNAVFGDVMAAYRVQYPHLGLGDTIGNIAEVKFDDPVPDLLKII